MKKQILSGLKILAPPAVLIALFMVLRNFRACMDAVRPVVNVLRQGIGTVTALLPFSLYEAGATALVIAFLAVIIKTIIFIKEGDPEFSAGEIIVRRTAVVVSVAGYLLSAFLWLWCTLYYTTPFYEGALTNAGVTYEELMIAAEFFLNGVNEYAPLVKRGDNGEYAETSAELIRRANSALRFDGVKELFPTLNIPVNPRVKPMLYSELMSITGFTGIYFAPTAEANVNINAPAVTLPCTIAHELSHSLGVAPENETDFLAIVLCIESGDLAYKYAGYLSGLIRIGNAVFNMLWYDSSIKFEDYRSLMERRSHLVEADLNAVSEYWAQYNEPYRPEKIGSLGDAIDAVYAAAVETVSETTEAVYDGYLKSQGQELGIRSYGACVDLVVEWLVTFEVHNN